MPPSAVICRVLPVAVLDASWDADAPERIVCQLEGRSAYITQFVEPALQTRKVLYVAFLHRFF